MKQCLIHNINAPKKLLVGGLAGCGIVIQICQPSFAESLSHPVTSYTTAQTQIVVSQSEKIPTLEFSPIQIADAFNESNPMSQVTSVGQLVDVKPTDWAYQALRSLMERYGVIGAFPDGKFRGNQPISRYEFAAALAVTFDRIEALIATAISDEYIQEDMKTVQRLRGEFRDALDDLDARIGTTEQLATRLEAEQFSTTTKLQGQVVGAISDGSFANRTIIYRSRLNLTTTFNQKDLLVTQLESGNNGGDAVGRKQQQDFNLLGSVGLFANAGGLDYTDVESDFKLRRLYYTFYPVENIAVTVGAKMSPRDFIDKNRYANNEAFDFSSGLFLNNPLIVQNQVDRYGGAGIAVVWHPQGSKFTLRSLYIAADAARPNFDITEGGLFGDRYQATIEAEYAPNQKLTFRLQYTNALINNTDIHALGVNADYAFNRNLGIFGRFGIGNYQGFNTAINKNLDLQPISWSMGVGIRNLFIPGTLGGVAIGQPFITGGLGNATQTNFEAFYNLALSENITITPIFSLVSNADNDSSHGLVWQTSLRSVFSF